MKAGLRCCCLLLVSVLSLTTVQGNRRDLRQWLAPAAAPKSSFYPGSANIVAESAPAPTSAGLSATHSSASATAPAGSSITSLSSKGSQTPPGFPGPPPPPPPPPPPSPGSVPSPPPPPPPPPPIQYWPSTAASGPSSHSALSGSGAPSDAPTFASGTQDPYALAPGPGPANKVSNAATVPSVSAAVTLPSFTLQSFDTAAQAQFINTIEAAYPGNNVSVTINNIMSGSVVVNETTTFVDGDSSAAESHAQAMANDPASIFPSGTYGNVITSGVTSSNATNPAVVAATSSPTPVPTSGTDALATISLSALVGASCLVAFSL